MKLKVCEICGTDATEYCQDELLCPVCGALYVQDVREIDGWTFAGYVPENLPKNWKCVKK